MWRRERPFMDRLLRLRRGGAQYEREQVSSFALLYLFSSALSPLTVSMCGPRFCEAVERAHKSNNVMFVVDFREGAYYQRCHDPECKGTRGSLRPLPPESAREAFELAPTGQGIENPQLLQQLHLQQQHQQQQQQQRLQQLQQPRHSPRQQHRQQVPHVPQHSPSVSWAPPRIDDDDDDECFWAAAAAAAEEPRWQPPNIADNDDDEDEHVFWNKAAALAD